MPLTKGMDKHEGRANAKKMTTNDRYDAQLHPLSASLVKHLEGQKKGALLALGRHVLLGSAKKKKSGACGA